MWALTIAGLQAELEGRFAKQDAIPAEDCPSTTDERVEDFPQDDEWIACWWDPIIPTPVNPLSIDSFQQIVLEQSLFRQLPHPLSIIQITRPHYKSITHCNSDTRYWSKAFTIPNSTIIPSSLSTRYSTALCILPVGTFTYTSISSDFTFSFSLSHFCIRVHVS